MEMAKAQGLRKRQDSSIQIEPRGQYSLNFSLGWSAISTAAILASKQHDNIREKSKYDDTLKIVKQNVKTKT